MSAGILVLLICLGFGGQVHATLTDEHQATLDAYHSTPCREMFGRGMGLSVRCRVDSERDVGNLSFVWLSWESALSTEGGPVLRRSVLKKGVIIPRGPKLSTPGTFQRVLTKVRGDSRHGIALSLSLFPYICIYTYTGACVQIVGNRNTCLLQY